MELSPPTGPATSQGEAGPTEPGFQPTHHQRRPRMTHTACIQCGAMFLGKPGRKLCSDACRRAHRPGTYRTCEACGARFGPVDHLSRKFCGWACKVRALTTGQRVLRKTHRAARNAQSLLRYHVQAGHIVRPSACEQCGRTGCRIEGAHYRYDQPLRVRWLCVPCRRRWDQAEPKGATYRVSAPRPHCAAPAVNGDCTALPGTGPCFVPESASSEGLPEDRFDSQRQEGLTGKTAERAPAP